MQKRGAGKNRESDAKNGYSSASRTGGSHRWQGSYPFETASPKVTAILEFLTLEHSPV
jgi:hypothetical protein